MPPVDSNLVILAINARYSHSSLAARSLMANMQHARPLLLECEIKQTPQAIFTKIAQLEPSILAISVYIWNRQLVDQIVPLVRENLPQTKIILGGPEITYDTQSSLANEADCVICGEAEEILPKICENIANGKPVAHIQHATPPNLAKLAFPTEAYTDQDLLHRNIYIETSRGCPCACSFCLSSLTCGVRYYPLDTVLAHLEKLYRRGARHFRFVDRSFNLAGKRAVQILQFFEQKRRDDLFIHLEVVPEFLFQNLRDLMVRFPPGSLHIETGIQSLSPEVLQRINRPANPEAALEGIHWLTHQAHATVHADLIAGLPGETLHSFIAGFEKLYRTGPAEIQLGCLKHLPGTKLHQEPGMRFHKNPPYQVIASDAMSPADLDQVHRFASHWERVINRNHFPHTTKLLLQSPNIWHTFNAFSLTLERQHGRYGIGLVEIAHELYAFLNANHIAATETIRAALEQDYLAEGRRMNLPAFLRPRAR